MRPYWIMPDGPPCLGFGVTAESEDAAVALAEPHLDGAKISSIRAIRDISELDQNHVVPNMGVWLRRGVWFPDFGSH